MQVVSLSTSNFAGLETQAQRAEFIRKALQDNAAQGQDKQPSTRPLTSEGPSEQQVRPKDGDFPWTSSSDKLNSDLGRPGGTFSDSNSMSR